MSQYIDTISPILYGKYGGHRYGAGKRTLTAYPIGHHPSMLLHPLHLHHMRQGLHGGNSAPQYWDYPNATSRANTMQTQYGGRRRIRGRGDNVRPIPPRYSTASSYQLGNDYRGGYTQSPNTYIGGRRKRRGGWISQEKAYQAYNNY